MRKDFISKLFYKLIFLLSFMVSISAYAFKVESKLFFSVDSALEKKSIFTCDNNESFCINLCSQQNTCVVDETLCTNCLSQKAQDLKILFNNPQTYFETTGKMINSFTLSYFFKNQNFLLIDAKSFLNNMTPEKVDQNQYNFQSFCGNSSSKNLIIIDINSQDNTVKSIPGIICQNEDESNNYVLKLELKSEFKSQSQSDFWKKMTIEVYNSILEMKLKMDYGLSQPYKVKDKNGEKIQYLRLYETTQTSAK